MKERFRGSLLLSAIADALGFITEGVKTENALIKKCGVSYVDCFYDWKMKPGRWGDSYGTMPSGAYSDDTQLTLCTLRSIKPSGKVDFNYFSKIELSDWYHYRRGAGSTISAASLKINRKSASWNNNYFIFQKGKNKKRDYRDCGANGAAMRVLPIALANAGNFPKMKEQIFGNTIVTHGHPRAIIGAILYGYCIHTIFKNKSLAHHTLVNKIIENFDDCFNLPFLKLKDFYTWKSKWDSTGRSFTSEYKDAQDDVIIKLDQISTSIRSGYSLKEIFRDIGCFDKLGKGYGTYTVLGAISVFSLLMKQPIKGINKTVNMLGTDTDTIGSIAGGMLGAYHGDSILPEKWKIVQDYSYIISCANRLFDIYSGQGENIFGINSTNKNTLKIDDDIYKVNDRINVQSLGDGTITDILIKPSYRAGKKKIYLDAHFDIGQTCTFGKLINN